VVVRKPSPLDYPRLSSQNYLMEPAKIWYHFTLKIDGAEGFGFLHILTKHTLEKNANKKFLLNSAI
jgi:hypothetical protein